MLQQGFHLLEILQEVALPEDLEEAKQQQEMVSFSKLVAFILD